MLSEINKHLPPISELAHIRDQFPILQRTMGQSKRLVYLDNAATTQKPQVVIDALRDYYENANANIHRGIYPLAAEATAGYEGAREKVSRYLNAEDPSSLLFVRGTTEGINLVCQSYLRPRLSAGDNVVISAMEHHSNLIPWQMACKAANAELRVIPMTQEGELDTNSLQHLIDSKTQMVALVHVSNSLGTVNPVEEIIGIAHQFEVPVLIDGAQSLSHFPIDVQAMDCDFFVFSGHKCFGPMGIGGVYGKKALLDEMEPYQFGGEMIRSVTFEESTFKPSPQKFEAGTPNVAGAIGLGVAVDFLHQIIGEVPRHDEQLLDYAQQRLSEIDGLRIYGTSAQKVGIVSFTLEEAHPHDLATILGEAGVAVRAGHHCTQPIMDFYELPGTTRASFSIYNTRDDVEALYNALLDAKRYFQ